MIEGYLAGKEGTVTVMPALKDNTDYWSMPIVVRFNREDGIAPYNRAVTVTLNSCVSSINDLEMSVYKNICEQCTNVARRLKITVPIRIDVRQVTKDHDSEFAPFDVNMEMVSKYMISDLII